MLVLLQHSLINSSRLENLANCASYVSSMNVSLILLYYQNIYQILTVSLWGQNYEQESALL